MIVVHPTNPEELVTEIRLVGLPAAFDARLQYYAPSGSANRPYFKETTDVHRMLDEHFPLPVNYAWKVDAYEGSSKRKSTIWHITLCQSLDAPRFPSARILSMLVECKELDVVGIHENGVSFNVYMETKC